MNGAKISRRVRVAMLAGGLALAGQAGAAEPVLNGDGIGTFSAYDPAKQTVTLGEREVRLSPDASASMLQQVRHWQPALAQKKPFRVKFAAENGVIHSILLEPRGEDSTSPQNRPGRPEGAAWGPGSVKRGGQ
jgi:hypothetical protein